MSRSTQHKLDSVRPPRVQITYDVEIGDAAEKKFLAFVVGVLADVAGQAHEDLPRLRERKFIEIDRGNFNEVMRSIAPRQRVRAPFTLGDGSERSFPLEFKSLDDFGPMSVIDQVEPLRQLLEARQRLTDLLAKLDGNTELSDELQQILADDARLKAIQTELKGSEG
ncbi:MAG: type VI secretion system contractile sheath small subunit [Alphaproteobacteria bacterium]|nr:type VI secretion system contractile sheath small subunit [Alphaproteobacteria bacterium]